MYLRQGRTAEVRQLAEEMIAVFQEQNLPDDTLRALRLCAAAAQSEELTADHKLAERGLLQKFPPRSSRADSASG